MKRRLLLLTLAIPVLLCQNAVAQTSSRLVGEANWANNGAEFKPVDTGHYTYSGGRGGDLNHSPMYDYYNTWVWDAVGDTAFMNSWYYIQTYDSNGNLANKVAEFWNGTSWTLYSNTLYTYNSSNQLTTMIYQTWGGSSWQPLSQDVYTYNSGGKMIIDQYQQWNSLTSMFEAFSQKTYYYDAGTGNLLNRQDQVYSGSTPTYTNQWSYTYSTTSQLLTTTHTTWNGSGWDNSDMTTNTFDSTGNMTNQLYQTWDAPNTAWLNNTLHIYSAFNAGHMPGQEIRQVWNSTGAGQWDNQMKFFYTYNSSNQLTHSEGISWNIVGVFESALGDPMSNYYYEAYTPGVDAVKPVTNTGGDAKIYPVPAQHTLNVDLAWDVAQAADIAIYDATGKVVRQWNTPVSANFHSTVSVDNLGAGVYFIRINGAQGQVVKQLVIAH